MCKSDYERRLNSVLDKVLEKIKEYNQEFLVKFKEKITKVKYHEISYVEVEKHRIQLHLEKEILEYRGNLSDIEKQFLEKGFIKINSGCIVNLESIFRIQNNELILKNGEILVISRSNKKNVKDTFLDIWERSKALNVGLFRNICKFVSGNSNNTNYHELFRK